MRTEIIGVSGDGKQCGLVRRLSHEKKQWGLSLEPSTGLDYGKLQMLAKEARLYSTRI